jgi:hypothetical protein
MSNKKWGEINLVSANGSLASCRKYMDPTRGYLNVATAVIISRVFSIFPQIQRPPSESLQGNSD